jgi:hypothetical protein
LVSKRAPLFCRRPADIRSTADDRHAMIIGEI